MQDIYILMHTFSGYLSTRRSCSIPGYAYRKRFTDTRLENCPNIHATTTTTATTYCSCCCFISASTSSSSSNSKHTTKQSPRYSNDIHGYRCYTKTNVIHVTDIFKTSHVHCRSSYRPCKHNPRLGYLILLLMPLLDWIRISWTSQEQVS